MPRWGKCRRCRDLTFEEALKRLEEIVQKVEGGNLSLDEMMALYEEGMGLSRFCMEKLNEAERKVLQVIRGADGVPEVRELD
ncbi:MAG: exodeoxyribonuclease VII small subunit [Bacillota bacterium]